MNRQQQKYWVGIFGHYGNKNLGDEAIIWSTIQNLQERISEVKLIGFSINPNDTHKRYGIDAFPIRRVRDDQKEKAESESSTVFLQSMGLSHHLKSILANKIGKSTAIGGLINLVSHLRSEIRFLINVREQLKNLDALIICGSNQFLDNFGGPWGFPYTLYKWTFFAKKMDTKVFFVSVGAGPLNNQLSYWMLKHILKRADYLSYRDSGSRKLIEDNIPDLRNKGTVYPDLAHSLKTVPDKNPLKKTGTTVAINPMPVFDGRYWYVDKPEKYEAYINHLSQFIKYVLDQGYAVNLFNHHPKDVLVIEDLRDKLQKIFNLNIDDLNTNETIEDLITTISKADIVVATRFHATVLPLRLGKPVLGICYQRKSKELLEDVGLGEYSVDISDFTAEELCKKFDYLVKNIDKAKEDVDACYRRYSILMNEQWDKLAELIKN